MLFTLLVLQLFQIEARVIDELPHCSRSTVMEGEVREYDDFKSKTKIYSAVQLSMSLHETACISLKMNDSESSILHTLEFLRLEQHHPISGKYQFAIPRITPSCICDCAGGDSHCKMEEYNYKNCTASPLCYRTYHPVQSNVGCIGDQKSEACCQLKIEPYRDWTFTAIRVSQPDTVLIFRYRIFDRLNTKWRRASETVIEVPMNKGSAKFEFNDRHRIDMTVTGSRPNRELTPGMYFVRDGTHELRSGVPLNDILGSDLGKLGWLRNTDGRWSISNGPAKLKEKYHIDVQDCKAQVYTSTFNGEQVVLNSDEGEAPSYDLGQPLSDDPWIRSAAVAAEDRVVRVEHAEGTNIMVHISTEMRPYIFRHTSQFDSFSGGLKLDRESNRFMNVTFYGAKGTVMGRVYSTEAKLQLDMVLSVQVDGSSIRDYRSIISVPATINSSRYVCFHPSGDPEGEQCKWFSYEAQPLQSFLVPHSWQTGRGDCRGCNDRGVESILSSLDPRSWLDGVNSSTEALAMLVEGAGLIVMVMILVLICTKCIIPLARCSVAIATPPKK